MRGDRRVELALAKRKGRERLTGDGLVRRRGHARVLQDLKLLHVAHGRAVMHVAVVHCRRLESARLARRRARPAAVRRADLRACPHARGLGGVVYMLVHAKGCAARRIVHAVVLAARAVRLSELSRVHERVPAELGGVRRVRRRGLARRVRVVVQRHAALVH